MRAFRDFLDRLTTWGLESFGLYYSSYEATVIDVDDPKKLGLIRAACPSLWGSDTEAPDDIWCWPAYGPMHAKGGMWWPPAVGDSVHIRCYQGNASYPMYSPGFWGLADIADDFSTSRRILRTPLGWSIEFDDAAGTLVLRNPDTSGKIIMANDGRIDLYSGGTAAWFTLLASGSLQHVTESGGVKNRLRINANGTVFLGQENEALEIVRLIRDLVKGITTMTTPTMIGPQPPVNLAEFTAILQRIEQLIAPMPPP